MCQIKIDTMSDHSAPAAIQVADGQALSLSLLAQFPGARNVARAMVAADPLPASEVGAAVEQLVLEMLGAGMRADIPPAASFADGMYAREITIPAGMLCIGRIQRRPHISVLLQGEISMLNATGGVTRLKAPCTFASPAGVRKLGIAHTDVVWTTVHSLAECEIENPATATNEELEGFLVVDSPEDFMKFIEQRKLIGGGQ